MYVGLVAYIKLRVTVPHITPATGGGAGGTADSVSLRQYHLDKLADNTLTAEKDKSIYD